MPRRNKTRAVSRRAFPDTCQEKRRFSSELEAKQTAEYHELRQLSTPPLFVYKCERCGGWHLTSKEPNRS